jgi:DNA-binding NtrC family response regulator
MRIVDQEPDSASLLTMLIAEYTDHDTSITNNPWEALAMVSQGGIDLIIARLKMSGMDGMELLEQVKRINANIPVIIVSSYATVETALEVMRKGGFEFIGMPYRKEQMLFAIDNALAWAKLNSENRLLRELMKGPAASPPKTAMALLNNVML